MNAQGAMHRLESSMRPRPMSAVTTELVCASGDLDALIFAEDTAYDLSLAEQAEARAALVRASFAFHVERSERYRAYVERHGIDLGAIASIDLDAIPVYPTTTFKRLSPLSVREQEIEKWCLSSGTTGDRSRVPRDRVTLERLLGSVKAAMPLLTDGYEHEVAVVNLGPDREEAGDVWFGYVMSLVELLYPTRCRVVGGTLDTAAAIADLHELLATNQEVVVIGPPFLVLELAERARETGARFDGSERLTVVTAGGWKRFSGVEIPRAEFHARLVETLKLSSAERIRDAFNQVELNSVFIECSAHRKHVPPWVHATTRDPATLAALPRGERGLCSYLDASAESYPCFIVGEDIGVVDDVRCACGREGTVLAIERRVRGTPQRGCALTMDRRRSEGSIR